MSAIKDIQILGIGIHYIITFFIMITTYSLYEWVKKNKIQYLRRMLLIITFIFSALLSCLIIYDINDDKLKSSCFAVIIVCIVNFFRAKHDQRGYGVWSIIDKQKYWRKKHTYFFPKDFNNEELEMIKRNLNSFFCEFEGNVYKEKIGDLFIWIKKKDRKIRIKLVNQLDFYCDVYLEDIISRYNNVKNELNAKLIVTGEKDAKIELILDGK